MRRITELYCHIKEEELYRKNAERDGVQPAVEQGSLREDEKERILAKAMERIQSETAEREEGKRHLPGRKRLGILIFAAVLSAALTVSAAGYFQLRKELADSLDLSPDTPPEQLSPMLTDFSEKGVSVTEHGVTVRAEQAICDGRAACICFEIELPEGVFQENPDGGTSGRERGINMYWNGPVSWSRNGADGHADIFNMWRKVKIWIGTEEAGCGPMIVEKDADDPQRYYVVEMVGLERQTGSLEGPQKLKLELTDLGYVYADDEKTEWTTQIEGTWLLEWTMEFEDMSRTYEVHKEFQKDGRSVLVQTVQVSPLGILLTGTTEAEGIGGDFLGPGEVLTGDGFAGMKCGVSVWGVGEEGGVVTADGSFEKLMDVDDIIGVQVNGEDWLFHE